MIDATTVLKFKNGMKFRRDAVRDNWVVLGPERMFVPDEHATAVLRLIDGRRSVGEVVQTLATTYEASPEEIYHGVVAMVDELEEKGVLQS